MHGCARCLHWPGPGPMGLGLFSFFLEVFGSHSAISQECPLPLNPVRLQPMKLCFLLAVISTARRHVQLFRATTGLCEHCHYVCFWHSLNLNLSRYKRHIGLLSLGRGVLGIFRCPRAQGLVDVDIAFGAPSSAPPPVPTSVLELSSSDLLDEHGRKCCSPTRRLYF